MKEEGNITPRRETNPESERSSCRSDSVGSNPVLPVSVVSRGTRRERRNMLKSTHVIIIRFHLHFSNSNTPIQARNVYIMLPHQTDQPKRTGTGTGSEARGIKILQSDRPSIRCVILDEPGSGLPCLDWSFFVFFLFVSRFRSSLLPASISLGEPLDVWIFGLRCCCCCWLTAGAFTPVEGNNYNKITRRIERASSNDTLYAHTLPLSLARSLLVKPILWPCEAVAK